MSGRLKLASVLAFLAFPILEIGLLIRVGQGIGLWRLALIVVVTAVLGASVIRRTGLAVLTRARAQVEARRPGFEPLFDGLLLLTSGMLLIFPGLISDVLGLTLLIPPVRQFLVQRIFPKLSSFTTFEMKSDRATSSNPSSSSGFENDAQSFDPASFDAASTDGVTIEGEYERIKDEPVDGANQSQAPGRSLSPRPPRRSTN